MAAEANITYLSECFSVMKDRDVMIASGLWPFGVHGKLMMHDDETAGKIADSAWAFLLSCVADEVLWLRRYSHSLPGKLFALLDAEARQETLATLRMWWDVVESAERAAMHDALVEQALGLVPWYHSTWVRELLLGLAEANFELAPDDLLEELGRLHKR